MYCKKSITGLLSNVEKLSLKYWWKDWGVQGSQMLISHTFYS